MLWTGLLRMTGIALALILAGIGFRVGQVKGKVVFVIGVFAAVGLLVMATAG